MYKSIKSSLVRAVRNTGMVRKLFISCLLVTVVLVGSLLAYNNWTSCKMLYEVKREEIKRQAEKLANAIDHDISSKKRLLEGIHAVGASINDEDVNSPLVLKHLVAWTRYSFPSEAVFIINTKGDVVFSSADDMKRGNYADSNFFREAMKGKTYVSEPAIFEGKGLFYYSTPIRNYKEETIGVLTMRRQAEELWKLFEKENDFPGKGSACILIDKHGVGVAHSNDRNLLFKAWKIVDPELRNNVESEYLYDDDRKVIDFIDAPDVFGSVTQDTAASFASSAVIKTKNKYGYCIPLKEKDWNLIYTVPASTFLAQIKHLTRHAIFSAGAVLVLLVVAKWNLLAGWLRPMKNLAQAANVIANDNLDHPMNTAACHDEIGRLNQSFHVIRNKLKSSYQELNDVNVEAVLMLARACEVRDNNTGSHVLRIKDYATLLAKELGLAESFVVKLGTSSILHDVGKIHIPDYILRKQGSFTAEEKEIMKNHTLYGDKILGNSKYFDTARVIARWHHENWDGTGYPDGLKGEEIPVAVRIVRLADTYDALVTKRHYKDAWPHEKAYDEIIKWSGSYFDPEVVAAFKRLHKKQMVCLVPCV